MEESIIDRLFREIFTRILDGEYGIGGRLPSERDLAVTFEVSRVSIREVVQRLEDHGIIVRRRGSGATVQARQCWTIDILALVLRHALENERWDGLELLLRDAFALRRLLLLEFLSRAASLGHTSGFGAVRKQVYLAWSKREEVKSFVKEDRKIFPMVLEAVGMYPSLWTLNGVAGGYMAIMNTMAQGLEVPAGYVACHLEILDAIEKGSPQKTREALSAYLDQLDENLLRLLPEQVQQLLGPASPAQSVQESTLNPGLS